MALIEWNEDLGLGVDAIDGEHKALIAFINELDEAMKNGTTREALGRILDSVIAYTVFHFRHEEELFCATDYPSAQMHIAAHAELSKRVMEIQSKYRFGATEALSDEMMIFLKDWALNHIRHVDKTYVPYLKTADAV